MARDSELIAFQAGGLGPVRVYRALLLVALPLALVTGWLSLVMKPYASMEIQRIEDLNDDEATQASGLQPGRFYQQENGRVTFYAAEVGKDNRFRAVFVQDRRGDSEQIVLSRTGYYTEHEGLGDRAIVLEDGRRFVGTPGEYDYSVADFERFTYFLKIGPADAEQQRRRSAMPTAQLLASDEPRDRAELQHRLSAPLAVLTQVRLAIPLTTLSPRQRGGGRLFLAFVAYFAFFNLQRLAESWMETGVTPAWLGTLWYQPFIVATVGAALVPGSFWVRRLGAAVRAAVGRAGDRR
jgi:lipopolysaccharide export system permease protein